MEKRSSELVFVPAPALGHMASTIELANRLLTTDSSHHHYPRISITILVARFPYSDPNILSYFQSLPSIFPSIRFITLPPVDPPPVPGPVAIETLFSLYVEKWKPQVKLTITQLLTESAPIRLAGLVIDILFTSLIDVATELGVPAYLNFPTNAAMLGLMLHLPALDAQTTTEFTESDTELAIPSYANSVPPNVLPSALLNRTDDAYKWYVYHGGRFKQTRGILVNTFPELERQALESLSGPQRVYAVGPTIDLEGKGQLRPVEGGEQERIMKWLDGQPAGSVVLICFGSMGGLSAAEVGEIAAGLEASGERFLWSLRRPRVFSRDEEDPREWLPEGFEGRVEGRGVMCGWINQVVVLGHGAIGGFVSHCGWNSILESLWYGVPIATWPMYAEQQLNAFYLAREKGLAVEIRVDSRLGGGGGGMVTAEEVERGVREVMEKGSEVRRRVGEMSVKCREAVGDGGSSIVSMEQFIEELINGGTL